MQTHSYCQCSSVVVRILTQSGIRVFLKLPTIHLFLPTTSLRILRRLSVMHSLRTSMRKCQKKILFTLKFHQMFRIVIPSVLPLPTLGLDKFVLNIKSLVSNPPPLPIPTGFREIWTQHQKLVEHYPPPPPPRSKATTNFRFRADLDAT